MFQQILLLIALLFDLLLISSVIALYNEIDSLKNKVKQMEQTNK